MSQNTSDKKAFSTKAETLLTSKHLNRALMNSLPYPAMLISKERKIITANQKAIEIGVEIGSFCWDTFGKRASIPEKDKIYYEKNNTVPSQGIQCTFCKANAALTSQEPINEKIPADDITYDTYWIPLTDDIYLHYAIILP